VAAWNMRKTTRLHAKKRKKTATIGRKRAAWTN
jgi:hypothetical protein